MVLFAESSPIITKSVTFLYLVLDEYRKRQVFLSSSRILLFRNRIETLSKIEQSGWNPTGVGIKGASSAAVKKVRSLRETFWPLNIMQSI